MLQQNAGIYFPLTVLLCRVGNELGAGRPRAARTAAAAGVTVTPLLWAMIAVILSEPHLQRLVLLLYLDGSDPVLWRSLSRLLLIVAVVELFDGLQTTLGGVVQVCHFCLPSFRLCSPVPCCEEATHSCRSVCRANGRLELRGLCGDERVIEEVLVINRGAGSSRGGR